MIVSPLLYFSILYAFLHKSLSQNACTPTISRTNWFTITDPFTKTQRNVFKYNMINCHNITVEIISYGASISSVITPDLNGTLADIVLGFKNMDGYLSSENAFLGATLGRVANRIGQGFFKIQKGGREYEYVLDKNDGNHTIHGGPYSFGKVFWEECASDDEKVLSLCHTSPDGEGGFPAQVKAKISYKLTDDDELIMTFEAETDGVTPINMANHAYFNLAGHNAGSSELYEHYIQMHSNKYTPVGPDLIPTGEIKNVEGTRYDLRNWIKLGSAIFVQHAVSGFDNNFVLSCREKIKDPNMLCLAARMYHPTTKRMLLIYTTQPGLQFYTSNSLSVTANGKDDAKYGKHSAFAMEAQNFPDAVNQPNFPNSLVEPGQVYRQETVYKFKTTMTSSVV